jgi:hypothetical protein
MLVPCEVAVKCVLPAVRAMMAKQLMTKHGLNQEQAAKLLRVSQPAISLYNRRKRGKAIDLGKDAEITKLVENLAASLVESKMTHKEFIPRFCEICRTIRAKGLLCKMHKTFDPTINIEECELCMTANLPICS